jgi:hypothetical protein
LVATLKTAALGETMSQHIFETNNAQGAPVTVTMGYDRPLDYVFCTVLDPNDKVIYSNLDDVGAGTHQQDVDYYRSVLLKLGLHVPELMFREVKSDQLGRVGNRVKIHYADK